MHRKALVALALIINTGATAQTLYPHTTFDLDEYEATVNALGATLGRSNLGTLTRVAVPTTPQGTLTPVSAADADELEQHAAQGSCDITLTGDCPGGVTVARGRDIIIRLNGHTIGRLSMHEYNLTTQATQRMLVVGPGRIGTIATGQSHVGYPNPTDVVFDGVWVSADFLSPPTNQVAVNGSYDRLGVVNCIIRGYSDTGSTTCGVLVKGSDICFYNTNIGAGLNSTGFNDDWGYRMAGGSSRHLVADCMIRSRTKPCFRQGGDNVRGRALYSTPSARGTDRMMTLYNSHRGTMDASVGAGNTIDTDNIVNLFIRWFAGEETPDGTPMWGPHTKSGFSDMFYVESDIALTCEASLLDNLGVAARTAREQHAETGEIWELDGGTNTEVSVATLPDPVWPDVTSPAVGTIGNDPYAPYSGAAVAPRRTGGPMPRQGSSHAALRTYDLRGRVLTGELSGAALLVRGCDRILLR